MQLHLTLIVQGQGHSDFETSRKGAELGYMLLLSINRKVCMESIGAIAFDFHELERPPSIVTLISKAYIL